ncbi:nicotinamide-nucleotide amidase [Actinopolyspora xinjiangensis]|uniref:Nicotinamide-nucleotide amidase n=1 Tax=Actinopolyspora xinjiangensis TaxID=405564 RepID=A0A1H0SUZ6_9ACTN|nr:CinA family protein [Actinopolyspora xinjiangensis]SDP45088.1 nicotinamide-nucleotide amidase [Actinopolyspora xinjiangensis]
MTSPRRENADDEELVSIVLESLRRRGHTLATAESLTAGMLSMLLTSVSGASSVVRGGLVVYATDLKSSLAGVSPELLARHGAVHPEVAEQLAEGARRRCGADWGVGLTGVAGPDWQDGVSPGTVHLGFVGPERSVIRTRRLSGDRGEVRRGAASCALEHLAGLLR